MIRSIRVLVPSVQFLCDEPAQDPILSTERKNSEAIVATNNLLARGDSGNWTGQANVDTVFG